jgi:hypothetical protein
MSDVDAQSNPRTKEAAGIQHASFIRLLVAESNPPHGFRRAPFSDGEISVLVSSMKSVSFFESDAMEDVDHDWTRCIVESYGNAETIEVSHGFRHSRGNLFMSSY